MGFETFLGNAQAVASVREMLARGRVPGAVLFSGPEGVGKRTLAEMAAKALNCESLKGDFCGDCAGCRRSDEMLEQARADLARRREIKDASRRTEGLVSFDLQLIEPITRFILTEQIRHLRASAYTRPFELRRRIFILDQAQTIHWQAADLLLKVLEEPPETTTFFLIAPNPHELRATLRSRCMKMALKPVPDDIIREILAAESRVPAAQKELAVRAAAGNIRAARSFDWAEYQRLRQPWTAFLEMVTRTGRSTLTPGDWKALFEATRTLGEWRGGELGRSLEMGYTVLGDMLRILETGDENRVVNLDLVPRLRVWAQKLQVDGIEKMKRGLDDAYRLQTRNVNQQLGWEALAAGMVLARG